MKKLGLALVLFISMLSHAQVSINVNIGTPPNWGPTGNDDSRYYYLPDIDVYYDVNKSQFICDNNGKWVRQNNLPSRYKQYDLYDGYKVVLKDYKGDSPYVYHKKHRSNYPKGYQGKPQKNRGNKPEKQKSDNDKYTKKEKSKNSKGNSNKDENRPHNDHH